MNNSRSAPFGTLFTTTASWVGCTLNALQTALIMAMSAARMHAPSNVTTNTTTNAAPLVSSAFSEWSRCQAQRVPAHPSHGMHRFRQLATASVLISTDALGGSVSLWFGSVSLDFTIHFAFSGAARLFIHSVPIQMLECSQSSYRTLLV